ncbi:hypothetical protein [Paraburkholderia phosphatilytica]|nr:hypothetical protein [Paraburkholderia phosphatilytica]
MNRFIRYCYESPENCDTVIKWTAGIACGTSAIGLVALTVMRILM